MFLSVGSNVFMVPMYGRGMSWRRRLALLAGRARKRHGPSDLTPAARAPFTSPRPRQHGTVRIYGNAGTPVRSRHSNSRTGGDARNPTAVLLSSPPTAGLDE